MKNITNMIKNKKLYITGQTLLGLVVDLLSIYLLLLISRLTNHVISNQVNEFIKLLPLLVLIVILQVTGSSILNFQKRKQKTDIGYSIRSMIHSNLLHTSQDEKDKNTASSVISFINNEISVIQEYLLEYPILFKNPIIIVIAFVCFYNINIGLLLISCILIPASSFLFNKLLSPLRKKSREILDGKEELNKIIKESTKGFYIIKSFRLQRYFFNQYTDSTRALELYEKEKDKIMSILGRVFIILRYIPQLVIPLYGGYLCFNGDISLGDLIACNSLIWYIIAPIEELLDMKKKVKILETTMERFNQLKYITQEKLEYIKNTGQSSSKVALNIKEVSFSYSEEKEILKGINLHIQNGESVKIIGKSGAGKSTLIKILCGLNTGFEGFIEIAGITVSDKNVAEIRSLISYMPQSPYIFQDTLYSNITMGKEISKEVVLEFAKKVNAYSFIMEFPDKLDTKVGNGGLLLSGGQKKKIALIRAALHDGTIFIMDEPFSGLDQESIESVMEALNEICKEKTQIMITHQLENRNKEDKLYELREGVLNHV